MNTSMPQSTSELISWVLWNMVVPVMLSVLAAATPVILAWIGKKTHLNTLANQDAAANQALTNAITTFAGNTLGSIRDGKLTIADVKDGHVTKELLDYLNGKVAGAMLHFNKPPEDINAMLVGKIEGMIGLPSTVVLSTPLTQHQ